MKIRATFVILAVIVAASLAVRLVPALRCDALPEYSDMERYNMAALGIDVPEPLPPGYPLLLRAVYALFGARNYRAVFVVQSLLSSLTVLVLFWVTRRIAGERAALVAAGIAAVYPYFILYNLTTATETAGVLLVSLLMAIFVSPIGDVKRSVLAAAALFVSYLFKPVFVLFAPGIFASMRKRWIFAGVLCACLASWVAFSSSGKGYHRAARAFYKTYHPESDGRTYVDIWHTDLGDKETSTSAYIERAWSYVAGDPWRIAQTIYNKGTIALSRGWDSFIMRPLIGTDWNTLFVLIYAYIPIMLLGFAGMARLYDGTNRIMILSSMSYLALIILIAIFKVRYRLLVEPALIVYASMMIVWLLGRLRVAAPRLPLQEPGALRAALSRNWDILAVLVVAALALRVYFALAYDVPPTGRGAVTFDAIAASGRIDDSTPPLYILYLRAIYAIFGEYNHRAAYAVQGIIGSLSILPLYWIVFVLHSNRAGLVASAIAALYPAFILYNLMTLPETLCMTLVLTLMAVMMLRLGDRRQAALCGLLVGLAVLLKPLLACLAPGVAIMLGRRRTFVLALMLTLVPFTLINAVRFRKAEPVYTPYAYRLDARIFTRSENGWRALDKVYNNATVLLTKPWGVAESKTTDAVTRNSTFTASYIFTAVMLLGLVGLARRYCRSHRRAMLPVLLYLALITLFSKVQRNDRIIFEPVLIAYAAMLVCGKAENGANERSPGREAPA